jgi:single-stranded DNA-binding protein
MFSRCILVGRMVRDPEFQVYPEVAEYPRAQFSYRLRKHRLSREQGRPP